MNEVSHAFRPICLHQDTWPESHRHAWVSACAPAGLFDKPGGAAGWRASSHQKTVKGYGTWLSFLLFRGHEISVGKPGVFVTKESVRAYVEALSAINASMTVAARIQELYDAIRVMEPETDWGWLKIAMQNTRSDGRSSRNKRARLQTADRLEDLGHELMAAADGDLGMTKLQRALAFRDGLMIALLISRPLRIKNFTALRIGSSLLIREAGASIAFRAEDTKGKRPIDMPVPDHLVVALKRYIKLYRPLLLTTSGKATGLVTDALWISRDGTELVERSLHDVIRRRTEAKFGEPLPPHWFRDACVTTLVHDDPASARLSSALLGHASPEIAERHYNQALMIDSARRHSALVAELRSARKTVGEPPCAP